MRTSIGLLTNMHTVPRYWSRLMWATTFPR